MLSVDKRDSSGNDEENITDDQLENTEGATSVFFHKNRFEPLLAENSEEGGDNDGNSVVNGDRDNSNNDGNVYSRESDDDGNSNNGSDNGDHISLLYNQTKRMYVPQM